jgi:hypothetical protein
MMKKVLLFLSIFLFMGITSICAQTSKKTGSIKVIYDKNIESYALALSEILNIGIIKAKNDNFKIPKKLEIKMIESDRIVIRDNGAKTITMEYDAISNFIPPESTQFIWSGIRRIGLFAFIQVVKTKGLNKMTWMSANFRNCWSAYFAYNYMDIIFDETTDAVWPIPYNFKEDGTKRMYQNAQNENSPVYHEMNAWIDLGNNIGLDKFTAFFTSFKKGGCSKESFVSSLHKFMGAEAANQWEEKYMKYVMN